MINRRCTCALPTITELVRRVAYDYIVLHIFVEYFFDGFMDKGIGVGLAGVGAEVFATAGATMLAAALGVPGVVAAVVSDVALSVVEGGADAVVAVGKLGAVECAAAHLGGEVGAGDAEELAGHDVVDAALQVGNFRLESSQQPLGNLAQEYAAFRAGVEEARRRTAEQLGRKQVEHAVGQLGRGEDLVAAEVGQAVQYVR